MVRSIEQIIAKEAEESATPFDNIVLIDCIHRRIVGNTCNSLNNNRSVKALIIRRGDIYYADLRPIVGSEQGGVRPVLIIQNEAGNKYSSTVIIAAITSQMHKAKLPTHVELDSRYCDIAKDSVILLEQVRTIDKQRLKEKVCHLDNTIIRRVNEALRISLEL